MSLLSCLVTCSSGAPSTLTTIVIRETWGTSVGPTASDSMLNPRLENKMATRASTPGVSSTNTDNVCRDISRPTPNLVPWLVPPKFRHYWRLLRPSATPSHRDAL